MSTGVIPPPTSVIPPPARRAGSLPFPQVPAGTPNSQMPFDHLVVLMMENHSFDNLLGALSRTRPDVDGLTFDSSGKAQNWNPGVNHMPPQVHAFPLPNTAQATHITQNWKATHQQVNGGAMDGFVRSSGALEPMGYYTPDVLPFAYSLAEAFTLANRWFASAPAPTYPNRRFMLAGTAFGGTVTDVSSLLDSPPPNGTIFDVLSSHHINWCDYFTDVPMTSVIPSIVLKHSDHHAQIDKFFHDCQAGTLPAVSFVDAGIGVVSEIGSQLSSLPFPVKELLGVLGANFHDAAPAETEEDPQNMFFGEAFAHRVITAILQSPRWNRTLLIYTYDEHGGYYDHVPPPRVTPPDNIQPNLSPGDPPGGYDIYGPRVPAIVVSPCSKPGGVTNKVYDHTSILATIEHKWNLPALTVRDANANTIMDFLDPANPALINPPVLQTPPRPPGI
jgi:phospholipase C